MGHWGTLKFCKFCAFCSCCRQRNCKNFENYQRRTCNIFSSISPETRVIRLKQYWTQKKSRAGEEKKSHVVPPSPHFLATPLTVEDYRQMTDKVGGSISLLSISSSFFIF